MIAIIVCRLLLPPQALNTVLIMRNTNGFVTRSSDRCDIYTNPLPRAINFPFAEDFHAQKNVTLVPGHNVIDYKI